MKLHQIVSVPILVFILTFLCCKSESSAPTAPDQYHFEIDTTVLPFDSLGAVGGPGFYYKRFTWIGGFNPYWGDSVVKMLLDSNLKLIEFWYPEEPGICHDPLRHEREIARLSQPDTTIYRFGYSPLDSVYIYACVPTWRHYKIARVSSGD